jgi:hypothetical protein
MKITIQATLPEGPATVTTDLFTIVQWERKFKRKMGDGGDIGVEDLAYLFHEQAKRTEGVVVPIVFDDFLKKLVDITTVREELDRPISAATDAH